MNISVLIVADSINPLGNRITSAVLRYPLMIHNEVMTHRAFSRNAASSRAIPLKTMIETVEKDPAGPVYWAANQSGMQATGEVKNITEARDAWMYARMYAIDHAAKLGEVGAHKQIANRLLMPWLWMTTLVTATEWQNASSLRAHPDAQQEFQALMYCFLNEYVNREPVELEWGQWHMPFGDKMPAPDLPLETRLKIATARACWVSYNKHDKATFEIEDAITRHDSSMDAGHWSPFEHCAKAQRSYPIRERSNFDYDDLPSGWKQYRKMFAHERRTMTHIEMMDRLDARPEWIQFEQTSEGTALKSR